MKVTVNYNTINDMKVEIKKPLSDKIIHVTGAFIDGFAEAWVKYATNNAIVSGRNKHMCTKMHYLRERIREGDIKLHYISTKEQLADILTKNLPASLFLPLRDRILDPALHVPGGMH